MLALLLWACSHGDAWISFDTYHHCAKAQRHRGTSMAVNSSCIWVNKTKFLCDLEWTSVLVWTKNILSWNYAKPLTWPSEFSVAAATEKHYPFLWLGGFDPWSHRRVIASNMCWLIVALCGPWWVWPVSLPRMSHHFLSIIIKTYSSKMGNVCPKNVVL